MNIQKEIEISKHQQTVFYPDTELGELYDAMVRHWKSVQNSCNLAFTASLFYNLGRVHGIREERARRRGKP